MANINTFPERFRLGFPSASPFTAVQARTGALSGKLAWCQQCHDECDTNTQAIHTPPDYAWKQTCLRCGFVISRGIYHNVPLLSNIPTPAGVVEWSTEPGVDRR